MGEGGSTIRQRQLFALLSMLAGLLCTGMLLTIADHGVLFPFQWTADFNRKSYGITIDAGSHGTRGHLYEWSGRVENPQSPQSRPVTIPREIYTYEPGLKGISGFVFNSSEVGPEVLQPIIDAMKQELTSLQVSAQEFSQIPIYVKATAGMRNMDADSAEHVFSAIRSYLLNESMNGGPNATPSFKFEPDWARVVSGEEEGVFGWLAVNSDHGTLLSSSMNTIGALDLGGASAQVTFMPITASVLEDFYEVDLGEKVLRLYSHSFLGYGWDDSRMRLTTRLALGSFFNSLNHDIIGKNITAAEAIVKEFLAGNMTSFTTYESEEALSAKQRKQAIYIDERTNKLPIFEVSAPHPCFPQGFEGHFDIPSLQYPDGRFFLDVDSTAILAYMASIGYDLDDPAIQDSFPPEVIRRVKQDPLFRISLRPVMEDVIQNFRNLTIPGTAQDLSLAAGESAPFHPFKQYLPLPKLKFRVLFKGTGSIKGCQDLAQQLFYREPCFLSSCSYNGVYQPSIQDSHFLALGQFAKVRAALDIPTTATPNTLEKHAAEVCQTEWKELVRQNKLENKYKPFGKRGLANLCWKSVWAHATLTKGYGFDGESHAITFFDITDANGAAKSPGWALGAMLNEISSMPWESARGRFRLPFWWAFSSVMVVGLLAILQANKIRNLRSRLPQARSDVYMQFSPEQLIQ